MIDVNEDNFLLYAAKHYENPQCESTEEFEADLGRIKYIKRHINRYLGGNELQDKLLLNHIIVFYNVFGIEPATRMLAVKLSYKYWTVIKPFLIFLYYIKPEELTGIEMDENIITLLREKRKAV